MFYRCISTGACIGDVVKMRVTIAILDKHGDNAVTRMLDVLHTFDYGQVSHFGLVLPKKSYFEKPLGILNRQGLDTSALIGCVSSKAMVSSSYEFLQLEDAGLCFEGKVYEPVTKAVLSQTLSKKPQHCEAALQTLIEQADGDFQFMMVKNGWLAAGRDPIGVQPLYFGENRDIAAFATNRKALWRLGIDNPISFPPGNMGFVNKEGFKFQPVKTLAYPQPKNVTIDDAAKTLQVLLEESVKRRTRGLEKVAVAFSGGIDSSIVAFLANKIGLKVTLLHVSLENQEETEEAVEAAEVLDLPMEIDLFKDSDVENTLPKVVSLIEEADPVIASIGVPFYWTAEKAAEAKFKAVLAGQGADELFGGYQRYVNGYCKEGAEKTRQAMYHDVVNIHANNLERDLKIMGHHDIALLMPFASYSLAEFALSLPLECKIEAKPDTLRKLVLRKMAHNIGVPAMIADKPKKAVQYSTGINDAVKRIAKAQEKTVSEYVTELFERTKNVL
jgi:asparagine synthase (glutamine-hydrolysing)